MDTVIWLLGGGAVPAMLMGTGVFYLFYLRGQPLCSPRGMLRSMLTRVPGSGISPACAVSLALAGTLGVGNIVGVANALWLGGAGALFWMWVSALAAMVLKYAEIVLAVAHRRKGKRGFFGGAVYYIRDYFARHKMYRVGTVLSAMFAVLMILDAVSMGCVIQVNAVSSAFRGVLNIPTWVCGLVLAFLTAPVIVRGSKGISSLTGLMVPVMSFGYIILSAAVLILRADAVGDAMQSVFSEAFQPRGAVGGVVGFLTSRAIRTGTMRGLLSNEAGCGTAPTAHACADAVSPAAQGIWGIFEVFVDTILLCTATATVILVSYPEVEVFGADAVMMTIRAYSGVLGGWSEWFFCAAVFFFGYATVICWANYGLESLCALTGKKIWRYGYFAVYTLACFLGAIAAPDSVWTVSDFAIASLTTLNLLMLVLMRREVRTETWRWLKK